jgi:sugar phosphate isomerase/epimerase
MQLQLYRHLWGVDDPLSDVLPRIKSLGYTGIETGINGRGEELKSLLAEHDLTIIPQVFTAGAKDAADVQGHLESLKRQIDEAAPLNPVMLNCHAGRDYWSLSDAVAFFEAALELADQAGVPIAHETHRGRFLFNPWHTRDLLKRVPDLKLCADLSHWVCVCERLIDDQQPIIELVARHTIHLHARVGFEEGPQVPDPRVQRYQYLVEAHERWWDLIWKTQAAAGVQVSTLTPEFGPPGYLHVDPQTGKPLADLWDICQWQADRQAKRFAEQYG